MNGSDNSTPLLVAVLPDGVSRNVKSNVIESLPDPSTAENRVFLCQDNSLCEFQSLAAPKDYSSFQVNGNYVIGDGNLYVSSPVDPLFWVVSGLKLDQPWQPLDQVLEPVDRRITDRLKTSRVEMLLDRMELSEDEVFYKFSAPKTLAWLAEKQKRVQNVLYRQAVQRRMKRATQAATGGAFSTSFTMTSDIQTSKTTQEDKGNQSEIDQREARKESLQIVCAYLTETWEARFLQHMQVDKSVVDGTADRKRARENQKPAAAAWDPATSSGTVAKKVKSVPAKSAGLKRLEKVNTKGMSKLSAFFGVGKKENKKNSK